MDPVIEMRDYVWWIIIRFLLNVMSNFNSGLQMFVLQFKYERVTVGISKNLLILLVV